MPIRVVGIVLLGLALGSLAAPAAESPGLEERLRQLEERMNSLARENADLRRALGTEQKSGAVLARPAGKEQKLAIGGLLQGQAEFGDKPDDRFPAEDRFLLRRASA